VENRRRETHTYKERPISTRRVVITGVGFVAPQPLADIVANAKKPHYDPAEITAFELPEGAPTAGYEVLDFNQETELPNIKSFIDKTSAFALGAGKRALADAGLLDREKRPAEIEIGCAYGTMMGCLEAMGIYWTKVKTSNPKFAQPLTFTHGYANSPSSLLCIENALKGPAATFSGERLSGAQALLFAYDQIVRGSGEAMLVCASESLTQAAWNHFHSTNALPKEGLGEGGIALVLESAENAAKRGAKVLSELARVECVRETSREPNTCFLCLDDEAPGAGQSAGVEALSGDVLAMEPLVALALHASVNAGRIHAWSDRSSANQATFLIETRHEGKGRIDIYLKKS
jgi:3-oxoacyl-(acyl-carrier-protein) synthase